jgi:glycosyltransferase involved in cell wall biosynthesis
MAGASYSRLVMLGSPQACGSVASVVEAYRAHGLFKRWPIEYFAMSPGALPRFAAQLARERDIVVHLHATARRSFWRDALFMGPAIAARCTLVLHLHGAGFERLHEAAGPLGRSAIRFFFEHAACILVPCESLRVWIASVARSAQVICLPNPVAPGAAAQEAARPNLVLFLGRLEPQKGLFDLLEALSALRPAVPDVRLVCAGEGDRLAVARYAEHLGIADAVKFTGWVGPSGKRALLESAAVFALPSYDETLPMSLLEAMSAGVPVVVSSVGGMPEVVVDGVSGFLAAPGDIATLQRLLRKLLLDRKLGARIGAAARESVRLRFAPERALPRLEALYAGLGLHSIGEPRQPVAADLRRAA